ncbi:hypothetical protein ACFX5L_11245 [Bacteroides sp. KG123]|uniref:hypothetical protein n=1 Tax=unclassified Bacteroides TaxID=2646097 RepID=UPI003D7FE28A
MMKTVIYRRMFGLAMLLPAVTAALVWSTVFGACSDEADTTPPSPDHTAILNLRMGSEVLPASAATSRAPMTRAVNETAIQTVDVLSFKADPADPANIKKGTFFYRAQGVYTEATPGQGKVEVRLISSTEAQTLVVLANVRAQVNALSAAYGEEKEDVMNRLLVNATTDGQPDLTNGMPMWGELPAQTVNESYGQTPATAPTVTMIRSVVKFTYKEKNTLLYSPSGVNLWYNGLKFEAYNFRTKGRIAPDNFRPAPSLSVAAPTVPAGATQAQGTHHTLADYVPLTYNGSGEEVSFYMFESDNAKANTGSALDATCLVVQFIGGPATGWHRLDFRDYAQPAGSGFMDLLRGHHYVIEPEEWDGTIGANSAEEAFRGTSKIKCRIVPWNEVEEDVKVPAGKRLTVDKRSIMLTDQDFTIGKTLTVVTENTGGWRIDPSTIPAWATFSDTSQPTDGMTTITIKATEANRFQSAKFKLTAGNAEMEIELIQRGKLPIEYVAEYNLAGIPSVKPVNKLVTPGMTGGLRFADSHDNTQSGYYSFQSNSGMIDFNTAVFSDGTLLKDKYHLPTIEEWTGIVGYSSTGWYDTPQLVQTHLEPVAFGNTRKTYTTEFQTPGNGIAYALRFKPATVQSQTGYPPAGDSNVLCAYRYERVGDMQVEDNPTDRLTVSVVYLGPNSTETITSISNESWWQARSSETISRVFPACGIVDYNVFGSSYDLQARGIGGTYNSSYSSWTGGAYQRKVMSFNRQTVHSSAVFSGSYDQWDGYSTRLFLND